MLVYTYTHINNVYLSSDVEKLIFKYWTSKTE